MTAKTTKIPTTKLCVHCNVTKSLEEFRKDRRKRHGVTGMCKECRMQRVHENGHLEQSTLYRHVERSKRAGVVSLLIVEDIHELKKATRCAYCQRSIDRSTCQVDHVRPLAFGGNTPENVVHCCESCNKAKQDRTVVHFMEDQTAKFAAFCDLFGARQNPPITGEEAAAMFQADYEHYGARFRGGKP